MISGRYAKQPVNRIGANYDGALIQPILREVDEELRRLRAEIESIAGLGTSGGGFAPTSEPYVAMAASANLSAERVLTAGSGVTLLDNGPNSTAVLSVSGLASTIQHSWQANGRYRVDTAVDGGWIVPTACTITAVWLYRTTSGTGGSTVLDVNVNGITIYSTQANRPAIPAGDSDMKVQAALPDVLTLAAGDVVTVDTDQIETGTPASWGLTLEAA